MSGRVVFLEDAFGSKSVSILIINPITFKFNIVSDQHSWIRYVYRKRLCNVDIGTYEQEGKISFVNLDNLWWVASLKEEIFFIQLVGILTFWKILRELKKCKKI